MKKIVIFILGILTVSCSNDASVYEEFPTSKALDPNIKISLTIAKGFYNEKNIYSDNEKFYFSGEKIILNLKNSGFYSKYKYNNNLLSEIQDFDPRNTLKMTTKLVYDNLERLVEIEKISYRDKKNEYFKYVLVYDLEKITVTLTDLLLEYTLTYEFKLNNNKEIISYNLVKVNDKNFTSDIYLKQFLYENGNLVKFDNTQITYSNIKNDYNFKKNLFGKEWKKNSFIINYLISDSFATNIPQSEVSEYLMSSSKQILENNIVTDVEADYEFNSQNKMTKETRKYSSTTNVVTQSNGRAEHFYEYN